MSQILVVDDSLFQRNKIRSVLEVGGYELLEAANGYKGLEMVTTNKPDCILLDLIMPGMGGLDVLRTLHNREITIPVIVLTADIQGSTRERCLQLGVTEFISKPFEEVELLDAIRKVLDGNV